ncbi:unnamed protein product, partial [Polarella glacialis]
LSHSRCRPRSTESTAAQRLPGRSLGYGRRSRSNGRCGRSDDLQVSKSTQQLQSGAPSSGLSPVAELYLERLRRGKPVIPTMVSASASAELGLAAARDKFPEADRAYASWMPQSPVSGLAPAVVPAGGLAAASARQGVATQLRQMASTCDDAVRRIDELGSVTRRLLEELGLGSSALRSPQQQQQQQQQQQEEE